MDRKMATINTHLSLIKTETSVYLPTRKRGWGSKTGGKRGVGGETDHIAQGKFSDGREKSDSKSSFWATCKIKSLDGRR